MSALAILAIVAGAVALAVLVLVLVVVAALRPAGFRVARSRLIAAPASAIVPRVADLRAWSGWSPFEGLDPTCTREFSGAASGVGAGYAWSGDRRVGAGRMRIIELRGDAHLAIDIEFLRPFKARNRVEFDFAAADGGTTVTWAMSGRSNLVARLMGLFIDCDAMIGRLYDQGLAQLAQRCERAPERTAAGG